MKKRCLLLGIQEPAEALVDREENHGAVQGQEGDHQELTTFCVQSSEDKQREKEDISSVLIRI